MAMLHVTRTTTASPETCWTLMADFANIEFFNPHLSKSRLLDGSPESGIGTTRQCNLKDGRNYIREKVIDWQEGRSYTVDIFDGTMPVDRAVTKLGLEPLPGGGTRIYMNYTYAPRYGIAGRLMDVVMMRRMFKSMLEKVIAGLAEKAEAAETRLNRAA